MHVHTHLKTFYILIVKSLTFKLDFRFVKKKLTNKFTEEINFYLSACRLIDN